MERDKKVPVVLLLACFLLGQFHRGLCSLPYATLARPQTDGRPIRDLIYPRPEMTDVSSDLWSVDLFLGRQKERDGSCFVACSFCFLILDQGPSFYR